MKNEGKEKGKTGMFLQNFLFAFSIKRTYETS